MSTVSALSTVHEKAVQSVIQNQKLSDLLAGVEAGLAKRMPEGLWKPEFRALRISEEKHQALREVLKRAGVPKTMLWVGADLLVEQGKADGILNLIHGRTLALETRIPVDSFIEEYGIERFKSDQSESGFGRRVIYPAKVSDLEFIGRMNEVSRSVCKWSNGQGRNVVYAESPLLEDPGMRDSEGHAMVHESILRVKGSNGCEMNAQNQETHVNATLEKEGMRYAQRKRLTVHAGIDLLDFGVENAGTRKHPGEMKQYGTRGRVDETRSGSLHVYSVEVNEWHCFDNFAYDILFAGTARSFPKP